MFRTRTGIAIASGMAIFAVLAFTLSFVSLNELAQRMGHPSTLSWIYPILVDGLAVFSTLGIFWRHDYEVDAKYEWMLLVVTSILSLLGNVANAMPDNQDIVQPIRLTLAGIPPILLVFIIHTVVRNFKFALQSANDGHIVTRTSDNVEDAVAVQVENENREDAQLERVTDGFGQNQDNEVSSKKETRRSLPAKPQLRVVKNNNSQTISDVVEWIIERELSGMVVGAKQIEQQFGVSNSTAKRRLREARQMMNDHELKDNAL